MSYVNILISFLFLKYSCNEKSDLILYATCEIAQQRFLKVQLLDIRVSNEKLIGMNFEANVKCRQPLEHDSPLIRWACSLMYS